MWCNKFYFAFYTNGNEDRKWWKTEILILNQQQKGLFETKIVELNSQKSRSIFPELMKASLNVQVHSENLLSILEKLN